MNKSEFRHNHFSKIQLLIKQRDSLNKKIAAEISQMAFIMITELQDVPDNSIIKMAERGK